MAGITLTGKITQIGKTLKVSDTFTKREVWLEIDRDTDWPQEVNIELIKDKCSIADALNVGDEVDFDVNIRGNRGTLKSGETRVFNQMNGWRVKKTGSDSSAPPVTDTPPPTAAPEGDSGGATGDNGADDLPF